MDHHGSQTLTSQEPAHLVVGRLLHLSIPHAPSQASALPAGKPRDEALVPEQGESLDASWCRPEPVTRLR